MSRKIALPGSIIIRRNDPQRDRFEHPQMNERVPVIIQPETAPKPIDDTSFFGVGRDPLHAWPHIQRYQLTRVQELMSVCASESFGNRLVGKALPGSKVVYMPVGSHIASSERVAIDSPATGSYGALSRLNPSPSWSPAYGKITP